MFGVECSSGDTFTDGSTTYSMTSMFVPILSFPSRFDQRVTSRPTFPAR